MANKLRFVLVLVIVAALSYWAGYVGLGRYFVSVDLSRSVASEASIRGVFENIDRDGNASGWAYDAENPGTPIEVHMWAGAPPGVRGGNFAVKTIANLSRGADRNGFSVRIPNQYAGNRIFAYALDASGQNGTALFGSPKTLLAGANTQRYTRPTDQARIASCEPNFRGNRIEPLRSGWGNRNLEFPWSNYPSRLHIGRQQCSDLLIAGRVEVFGNVNTVIANSISITEGSSIVKEAYIFNGGSIGPGTGIGTLYNTART